MLASESVHRRECVYSGIDETMAFDVRMKGFRDRVDVEDVLAIIATRIAPVGVESVSIHAAAGRQLAAPVVSAVSVPGFDRAAMDGYAVRGEETFGSSDYNELTFAIIGDALPGRPAEIMVGAGQAVRIMTGAPMPAGADAVVMAEATREEGGVVLVREPVAPGKNVGRRSEDIEVGQTIVAPPRRLRPQDVALCAAIGTAELSVFRRPIVALVITGNELLPSGTRPDRYCIVDANSVLLRALVERDGGCVVHPSGQPAPIIPDQRSAILRALSQPNVDCTLVSGSSSVGREDYAPMLVAELGELPVHGVNLRPASPTGLGFIGGRPVFLLPGNPVSCLSAYDLFAGPAIRCQGGREAAWPYPARTCRLAGKIASAVGRVDYVRVRIVADGRVEPIATSGASILSSTTRADGFVLVPKNLEGYAESSMVEVFMYDVQPTDRSSERQKLELPAMGPPT